jgi:hypothetical protein
LSIGALMENVNQVSGSSASAVAARTRLQAVLARQQAVQENLQDFDLQIAMHAPVMAEDPEAILSELEESARNYSSQLKACADEINEDQSLSLRVVLRPGGRYAEFISNRLKPLASSYACRIEDRSWQRLQSQLDSESNPAEMWVKLINELEVGDPERASNWSSLGFSNTAVSNLMTKIPVGERMSLAAEWIEDEVTLFYRLPNTSIIPLAQASPGQRAVQLLRLVLRDFEGPVVIDQPEDDLDNRYLVEDFVSELHNEKTRHQLIFVTHNANIAVHGDAENIAVMELDSAVSGQEPGASAVGVVCTLCDNGTIDQPQVRTHIENILEGGKAAFDQRAQKYRR